MVFFSSFIFSILLMRAWKGGELVCWFLWILPFLINTIVLWERIYPDSLKKGLMARLSLIGSVVVFLASIVVRVENNEMSGGELVVLSLTFITSLVIIMVLRQYRPSV